MNQLEKIRDRHLLHTFLQDCTARLRHQAFQSEIQSSKERLDKIKSYDDIDSFARDIGSQTQTKPTEVLKDLTSVIASS